MKTNSLNNEINSCEIIKKSWNNETNSFEKMKQNHVK